MRKPGEAAATLLKGTPPTARIQAMTDAAPNIEQQLKDAIESSDLTRYRLAKETGLSEGLLSNFVNGRRTITMKTAARLAAYFDLELRSRRKRKGKIGKGD